MSVTEEEYKVVVVQAKTAFDFETELNKVIEFNKTKWVQTHVTPTSEGYVLYTGVVWCIQKRRFET